MNGLPDQGRVIITAGEEFQRMEYLGELVASLVDPATRDFNLDILHPDTFSMDSFPSLVATFPLMAERRVVVLRNFDKLHPETRKKACAVIAAVPDTTVIVVEGEKVTLAPKPPAAYLVEKKFKQMYERDLPGWIRDRFARRGYSVTPKGAAILQNNVGTVPGELDSEVEKITVAAGAKTSLDEHDVERVVGDFRRHTIWNLCNAVGMGDLNEALDILDGLFDTEKNRESYYLSSIGAHTLKLAAYNALRRKGHTPDAAREAIGENKFLWGLNKKDEQARRLAPADTRRILDRLCETDSNLKRFPLDGRLTMELLLPRIMPSRRT